MLSGALIKHQNNASENKKEEVTGDIPIVMDHT